jgi:hypothetical protein
MFSIIYLELVLKKKNPYKYLYPNYLDLVYIERDTKY